MNNEESFQNYKSNPAEFVPDTQVKQRFGISLSKLRNDRHNRRGLPYYKWGRIVRYRITELDAIFSQHRIDPQNQ